MAGTTIGPNEGLSGATERQKSLALTHRISDGLLADDIDSEDAFLQAVNLIPEYLQHPHHAGAQLRVGDIEYSTSNFDSSRLGMECPIVISGKNVGSIALSYDDQAPGDPAVFLDTEREMLDAISRVFALYLKYRDEKTLTKKVSERLFLLDEIIEHSPAVAFIWDLSEARPLVFVSKSVEQFGYLSSDFESARLRFADVIYPDDLVRVLAEVESFVADDSPNSVQQYRIVTPENDIRWVRHWSYAKKNVNGRLESAQGIILDITEVVLAEEQARNYLDVTHNIFIVIDSKGIVIDANSKACELTGASREELIGSEWIEKFIPDASRPALLDYFNEMMAKRPQGLLRHVNDIVSISGEVHTIDWSHSFEFDKAGAIVSNVGFGIDITEQLREREQINELTRILMENPNPVLRLNSAGEVILANDAGNALIESSKDLTLSKDNSWQSVLDFSLMTKTEQFIELAVNGRQILFLVVPEKSEGHVNLYGIDATKQRETESLLSRISESLPGALFEYTMFADGSDKLDYMSPGCEDIWELPAIDLVDDPGKLWAMIHPEDFFQMQQSVFSSRDNLTVWVHEWRIELSSGATKWLRGTGSPIRHANQATSWTTIILDITDEKFAQASIEITLRQTVHTLSAALEARDPYTAGHQANVTKIALVIGREMGLEPFALAGLELAATVHDIGKIQIPAELLSKPGKLTAIEFEMLKTHSVVGYDLLKNVDFTWPIADIVRQHHERMDGSGYPDGLVGDQILLEARILAVADVLEAMASHRPYRAALGVDVALEEIKAGSGIRYDSQVVAASSKVVDEIKTLLQLP